MKNKLVLFLLLLSAAKMIFFCAALPAYAISRVEVNNIPTVAANTALVEQPSEGTEARRYTEQNAHDNDYAPDYFTKCSELIIHLAGDVLTGQQFSLKLHNAQWYFRHNTSSSSEPNRGLNIKRASLELLGIMEKSPASASYMPMRGALNDWASLSPAPIASWGGEMPGDFVDDTRFASTYDQKMGFFVPGVTEPQAIAHSDAKAKHGIYFRAGVEAEVAYSLVVCKYDLSEAVVTILENCAATESRAIIIPLAIRARGEQDVKIQIGLGGDGIPAGISPQTLLAANVRTEFTQSRLDGDVAEAHDFWELAPIQIKEVFAGALRPGEKIYLTLPEGYHFVNNWADLDPSDTNDDWKIQMDQNSGNGFLQVCLDSNDNKAGWKKIGEAGYGALDTDYTKWIQNNIKNGLLRATSLSGIRFDKDFIVYVGWYERHSYDKLNATDNLETVPRDDQIILVLSDKYNPSDQLATSLWVENLMIYADEDRPHEDIALLVSDGEDERLTRGEDDSPIVAGGHVTHQSLLVARRAHWDAALTAENVNTRLVSGNSHGRPNRADHGQEDKIDHRQAVGVEAERGVHAARVTLKEVSESSWWSSRTARLVLRRGAGECGARFHKIKIIRADNVNPILKKDIMGEHKSTLYGDMDRAVYLNDGEWHGNVRVKDDEIVLRNFYADGYKTAVVEMDLWVNVENGYAARNGKQGAELVLWADFVGYKTLVGKEWQWPKCVIAYVFDPEK
ncbi:MAG: hypothetical protein LBL96_06845 [Clostridiales bacterium]|nr:hypothetical protein [Clostridiales bacterium]